MTEPNPYAPPVVAQPPMPNWQQMAEDDRSARAHASWALGFAIFSWMCPPFIAALSIFLAWRALQLHSSPSLPAKRAIIAICISVVFTALTIGLAVWQFLDSSPPPQRSVPAISRSPGLLFV